MARIDEADRSRIARAFERQLAVGLHHGAQLVVYVDGEPVIDLAGGEADPGTEADQDGEADSGTGADHSPGGDPGATPETPETRHVLFSCTKPFAAATLHAVVEDGSLAYDDRVVDHWPEFADAGSEKAEITVRQVLSHTAGLPVGEIDTRPDLWTDWTAAIEAIEEMDPVYAPGERAAYHALTFGWLVGELVRRVSGRSIREAADDRVFEPLGMTETSIGLHEDDSDDVATLAGFDEFDRCRDVGEGLGGTNSHVRVADPFNDEAIHRATIPAANGIGTARDMARFYASLANGGELDGTRILDPETVEAFTTLEAETDADGTLGRPARYALGVWRGDTAADPFGTLTPGRVFGHAGLGSSVGWADPEDGVGFAYVTNGVREGSYEHVTRVRALGDAVRLALAGE